MSRLGSAAGNLLSFVISQKGDDRADFSLPNRTGCPVGRTIYAADGDRRRAFESPTVGTAGNRTGDNIMNIRRVLLMAGTVILVLGVSPASSQSEGIRVGIANIAPFGGDPPGGYCVNVIAEIGERAGMDLSFVPLAFPDYASSLTNGDVDVLCTVLGPAPLWWSMGIAFTSAIATNADALVVPVNDETPYQSLNELQGMAVGTVAGAPALINMLEAAGIEDVRTFPGLVPMAEALTAGEIAAYLVSEPVFLFAHVVQGNWPDQRLVETYPGGYTNYPAIAVRNVDTDLLGLFQAGLESLKADGSLAAMAEEWAMPLPPF